MAWKQACPVPNDLDGAKNAFQEFNENDERGSFMKNRTIDSRQLLAFATLARQGSFTAAAKELCLTQSAVSHAIKTLESTLAARLFDRVGKRARLTQAGERLLSHAAPILRQMSDALGEVEEMGSRGHGRLRVGTSTTACRHILPAVLREFKQGFPQCVIKIESGDLSRQMELLRGNQIDIALTLQPGPESTDMEFRPLFEDEMRFLVSPIHPWARGRQVPRERISEETLVCYSRGSHTFRLVDEHFNGEGIELGSVIELGSMEAIKELVKIGVGVGILAPWVVQDELAQGGLISLPLGRRKLKRRWGITFLRGRRLLLAEETFAGLCEAVTRDFGCKK